MHGEISFYKVTCPECGNVQYGFVGDNEDGYFSCHEKIEVKRGKKETVEECGYFCEKIYHLPDECLIKLAIINIKNNLPNVMIKKYLEGNE